MTQWVCDDCGLKSPNITVDALTALGWMMSMVWYGKERKYFRTMTCPKHRSRHHPLIDAKITRYELDLKV